jgi:hypothetical protein
MHFRIQIAAPVELTTGEAIWLKVGVGDAIVGRLARRSLRDVCSGDLPRHKVAMAMTTTATTTARREVSTNSRNREIQQELYRVE